MSTAITPARPSLPAVIKSHATLLFGMLALMWLLAIVSALLPFLHVRDHGIHPRTVHGLWGLLTAPFLHVGFPHLIANSVPFVVLGGIVLLGGRQIFWAVTLFV